MIPLSLQQIADIVDGALDGSPEDVAEGHLGDLLVTGPAFLDSRHPERGGLFVAVTGERSDGHDHAAAAVAGGATAVLGSRPTGVPAVLVDDVVEAIGRLARYVVDSLTGVTVLALTGSQGKTGVKDYLAQLLDRHGPTVATAGNYNNELGVPLTVLRADAETRYLVVEMGARGIGHIAYLCTIAPPSIAAVTNVGTAHLSEFGSREGIARAKGEIVAALPAGGVAVLNADDELVDAMAARTGARVLRFGRQDGNEPDVSFGAIEYDDLDRPIADFGHAGQTVRTALRQVGAHQLPNAAAALAMAIAAGMDLAPACAALAEAVGRSRWRMELSELPDGTVLVNDAYNANPESMRAGLDALAGIGSRRPGRAIAVLGEMLELGDGADAAHADIGGYAAERGIDVLVGVGEAGRLIADGAAQVTSWPGNAVSVPDRAAALAWLREKIVPGDVVLVKASRGVALETVVEGLVAEAQERKNQA